MPCENFKCFYVVKIQYKKKGKLLTKYKCSKSRNCKWINHKEYLKSPEWKKKRQLKLKRNPNCEICGSSLNLNIHHRHYLTLGHESLSDLMTLCMDCHFKEHEFNILQREVMNALPKL